MSPRPAQSSNVPGRRPRGNMAGRWHVLVKPWIRRFHLSALNGWYWQDIVIEPH